MKYVFLIGTAHQSIQVNRAIEHFNIPIGDVILLIQDVHSDKDLYNRIVKEKRYSEIHNFINWTFSEIVRTKKTIHFIEICKKIKLHHQNTVFFVSHYFDDCTHLFLSIIKPLKFYLMDEGTASYRVSEKRNSMNIMFKIKLLFKSFLYGIFLREPPKITYFTKFDFEVLGSDQKEIYLVPQIDNVVSSYSNQFALLGTSVVEIGIMDSRDYILFVKKIAKENEGKELIYFKHRKEGAEKLEEIRGFGFEIVELDIPFEKYFYAQSELPGTIASFFTSSVLINLSESYKNIPVLKMYLFPVDKLKGGSIFVNILRYVKKSSRIYFVNI